MIFPSPRIAPVGGLSCVPVDLFVTRITHRRTSPQVRSCCPNVFTRWCTIPWVPVPAQSSAACAPSVPGRARPCGVNARTQEQAHPCLAPIPATSDRVSLSVGLPTVGIPQKWSLHMWPLVPGLFHLV